MFHSIKEYSKFPEEEEYLLNNNAILIIDKITMNEIKDRVDVECSFSDFEACKSYFSPITLDYKDHFKKAAIKAYTNDNFILFEIFFRMAKFEDSIMVLQEISENVSDESNLIKYNSLGMVYDFQGDYDSAIQYYEKSLEIALIHFGGNYPDAAISYNNLGTICLKKGDYDKAIQYFEKSLKYENHPDKSATYSNMGNVYYNKGDYDTAWQYHERALDIQLSVKSSRYCSIV